MSELWSSCATSAAMLVQKDYDRRTTWWTERGERWGIRCANAPLPSFGLRLWQFDWPDMMRSEASPGFANCQESGSIGFKTSDKTLRVYSFSMDE